MNTPLEGPIQPIESFDVFISHASEDKNEIAFPLANLLQSLGVKVWYDEFVLSVGDSLSRKIDEGLARSRFGIVIVSPAFLSKNWPEYELRGLTSREIDGNKVILPVWHNVTKADVMAFSPSLADKFALQTNGNVTSDLASSLVKVVRPDIHQRFLRAMLIAAQQRGEIKKIPIDQIQHGIIRHQSLPEHYMARIITLHAVTQDVLKMSLSETINGFRCDVTPEREIRVWEHICSLYYIATNRLGYSKAKRRDIFHLFLYTSMAPVSRAEYNRFTHLKAKEIDDLLVLADSKLSEMEFE